MNNDEKKKSLNSRERTRTRAERLIIIATKVLKEQEIIGDNLTVTQKRGMKNAV